MLRRWKVMGLMVVVCSLALGATRAEAVPITGGIRFGGAIAPVTDWQTVNAIDIVNNAAVVLCNPLQPCSGAFAGFNGGIATYNDFSFNPLGGQITPLWAFAGFSFNLTAITSITRGMNGLILEGFGTLFGNGYEPTQARWSFSADETNMTFGFSSTTSAQVPDSGATILLLGAAMLGIAIVQRRLVRT